MYYLNDGNITITTSYQLAKQIIKNAREDMNRALGAADDQQRLELHDVDLGPVVLKDVKMITYVGCDYVGNDIPQINMQTGEPAPPQQLTVTLTFCKL